MKRILCISDIHGQYKEFLLLLEKISYNFMEDQLILLGDYVDRGNCNVGILYKVIELQKQGAIILKGNHDSLAEGTLKDLLVNTVTGNTIEHLYCGGENTINEFKKLHKDELVFLYKSIKKFQYIYQYENYILVHAGVNASKKLLNNTEEDFLWSRWEFITQKAYENKIIVFGHTPTINMKNELSIWFDNIYNDKIGIDCGSVFGGKLACLELPSNKGYYI